MNAPSNQNFDRLIAWPDTEQMRVPYQVFTDPRIFDSEQERIFRGPHWSFLALEAELPEPKDFKATYLGDTPVVVTRDGGRYFVGGTTPQGGKIMQIADGSITIEDTPGEPMTYTF